MAVDDDGDDVGGADADASALMSQTLLFSSIEKPFVPFAVQTPPAIRSSISPPSVAIPPRPAPNPSIPATRSAFVSPRPAEQAASPDQGWRSALYPLPA